MCDLEDCCEDCHVWSDKKCHHVGKYLAQLSTQCDRKAKASSSSFQGSSLHCLSLCNLPSPVCAGVMTALSSSVCLVTYSTSTPVVAFTPFAPLNVTPAEPSRLHRLLL